MTLVWPKSEHLLWETSIVRSQELFIDPCVLVTHMCLHITTKRIFHFATILRNPTAHVMITAGLRFANTLHFILSTPTVSGVLCKTHTYIISHGDWTGGNSLFFFTFFVLVRKLEEKKILRSYKKANTT